MYLYFNEKGILKEIVNDEAIRLGNNDLNHIYIYWENAPEVDSMWVKFKLPSGETTNELSYSHIKVKKVIPYDKQRDLKYFKDYVSYDFFDISIPDGLNEDGEVVGLNVLAEDGLVSASVRFVLTLGQAISTLGLITFNVEKSVIQADLGINQSQFDYLLKHCLLNTTDTIIYKVDDITSVDASKIPNNAILMTTITTDLTAPNPLWVEFYINNDGSLENIGLTEHYDIDAPIRGWKSGKIYYGYISANYNNILNLSGFYIGYNLGSKYYILNKGKWYETSYTLGHGQVIVTQSTSNGLTRLTNLLVDENMQVRGQIYKGMGTPTENEEVLNRGEVVTEIGEFIDSNLKDTNGKIKSDFLPSYVDDILEFETFDKFPTTGETGKIYVDMENNNIYRWSGTQYILISSIDLLELEKQLSRKANKDGYYPQMRVGLSDNLGSPDLATDEAPYTFRPTAGIENVSNGLANLRSVKGNTVVWNQLHENKDSLTTNIGITFTNNGDGTLIINGNYTGTVSTTVSLSKYNFPTIKNHKYLYINSFAKNIPTNLSESGIYVFRLPYNIDDGIIINESEGIDRAILITINAQTTYTNMIIAPQIFDLTLMFGAGNEPTSVEEFRAMFPNSYYEYNPGELVNVNVTGIKSVGFNAWDEEWEVGSINTDGQNEASTTRIRSKNYIPVIPGEKYRITYIRTQRICWYNENYEFVKAETYLNGNRVLTAPNGAHYARFILNGTDYSDKCCFNLSHSGYRDGEYEPYKTDTLHLDTSVYFPDGMKKAGSAYDELTYHKAIKRIGSVDLGTLYWYTRTDDKDGFIYTFDINDALLVAPNVKSNLLCQKYSTTSYDTLYHSANKVIDKIIAINNGGYIEIKDTVLKGMTSVQVRQALSGVILYYELAEPVETETNFTEDWFYNVDDFGTEQWLQTGSVKIPVPHTTLYTRNLRDDIRTLSETYANKSELEEVRNEIEFVDNKYSGYAHFKRLEVTQTVSDKLLDIIKAIYDTKDVNSTFYVDNYECRLRNAFSDYYFCDIIQFSGGTINQYVAGPHSLTGVLKLEDITYTTYTHEPYDDTELRNKINELETNILGALEADY